MEKRRKGSRVDKWLKELLSTDKEALPLDFDEMLACREHTCTSGEKCTIRQAQLSYLNSRKEPSDVLIRASRSDGTVSTPTTTTETSSTGLELTSSAGQNSNEQKRNTESPLDSSLDSNKKEVLKHQDCPSSHHAAGDRPDYREKDPPKKVTREAFNTPLHHTSVHTNQKHESLCLQPHQQAYVYTFYLVCGKEGSTAEIWNQLRSLKNTHPTIVSICLNNSVKISIEDFHHNNVNNGFNLPRRKVSIIGNSSKSIINSMNDLMSAFPLLMNIVQLPQSPSLKSSGGVQPQSHEATKASGLVSMATTTSRVANDSSVIDNTASRHCHSAAMAASSNNLKHRRLSMSGKEVSGNHLRQRTTNGRSMQREHRPKKLAQNVRFQLTSEQREYLFTQDEDGKPANQRLSGLLKKLDMELIFLERQKGKDGIPSVKVRFIFDDFSQLRTFCKEIDYQIPMSSNLH